MLGYRFSDVAERRQQPFPLLVWAVEARHEDDERFPVAFLGDERQGRSDLERGKTSAVQSTVHIYPIDGAVQDVAQDETAFAFRDADVAQVIAGMWPDPDDNADNIRWVRDYYAGLEPHSSAGCVSEH